ncbi:MAG: EAL domain-containing protein [Pseudomonadota bacterium]
MTLPTEIRQVGCKECLDGAGLDFDFSMAFQPIIDIAKGEVFAHEALVRGLDGRTAASVLGQVTESNRYRFDQSCRVTALRLASQLGMRSLLSINFLPNAVYRAETCIRATLEAARLYDFPIRNILFEVTEAERVTDRRHLVAIFTEYKRQGFLTALDDFGEGYSGLNLLVELQPDIIKLDMALVRDIHEHRTKRLIVRAVTEVCHELGIRVIAEGVETQDELSCLADFGITLFQGYLIARPAFEALPVAHFPGR